MRIFTILVGCALTLLFVSRPTAAETIPSVMGLTPFSTQTNYMSLVGCMRWQYFMQNQQWISVAEATALVTKQP